MTRSIVWLVTLFYVELQYEQIARKMINSHNLFFLYIAGLAERFLDRSAHVVDLLKKKLISHQLKSLRMV